MGEVEWRIVSDPAGQSWSQISLQVGSHVQVTAGWATAKPFDRAADEKVDIPIGRVQLYHTGRLVNVQQYERAFCVCVFDDRLRVNPI